MVEVYQQSYARIHASDINLCARVGDKNASCNNGKNI